MRPGKLFESLRDHVVQRSLIGKRKLDRTATRRALDGAQRELGERYRALAKTGRVAVPDELGGAMQRVKDLEAVLEAQDREIELLQKQPSTT